MDSGRFAASSCPSSRRPSSLAPGIGSLFGALGGGCSSLPTSAWPPTAEGKITRSYSSYVSCGGILALLGNLERSAAIRRFSSTGEPANPSKIANKRRPKKSRPPYRRYVYSASNASEERDSQGEYGPDSDYQCVHSQAVKDKFGNWQDFNTRTNPNIHSIYVQTAPLAIRGKVWPQSQFEKVDVLACCLFHGSDEYWQQAQLEEEIGRKHAAGNQVELPLEIICYVLEILLRQGLLTTRFLRLSKLFYLITAPMLYRRPVLRGDNFHAFVGTISAHKRLGEMVLDLDLSNVNQSGKNAFVAKLLKRSRPVLQHFTAPQTSFGLGPLMALRGCVHLRSLDLRLVSETLNLDELFSSIRQLNSLTHLSFPRSSIEINDYKTVHWPPRLQFLRVSGGISDDFLMQSEFPDTIRHMEFAHCPKVNHFGFQHLLLEFGRNLKSLRIQFPMPGLHANSLDSVFELCPNLITLEVSVDYLSSNFFDERYLTASPEPRPLRTLYIDSSGMLGTTDRLDPLDLALAISESRLPRLKNVRCTAKLGWDPNSEDVSYIAGELEERNGGLYIGY